MAIIDSGTGTTGMANVTNYSLNVVTPTAITQTGFVVIAGKNDDGTVVSGGKFNEIQVTEGNRLTIAYCNYLWDDSFNVTAQNTSKYKVNTTTQTVAFSSGFLVLNSGSITTTATNSFVQTYKSFPLFAKSELVFETALLLTTAPQSNSATEFGLFSVASNAAKATDGAFFRFSNAGQLVGVINYNGAETISDVITSPSANVVHAYKMVVQTNTVSFYVDEVLSAKLNLALSASTQGQPFMSASQPITFRHYITGATPASATQIKVSDVFVYNDGADLTRIFSDTKPGFGHMGYQTQDGFAAYSGTALYPNSMSVIANPPAMTNTAVSLGTGLGGQFDCFPGLANGTDGIVCSYQIPSGSTTQTARNLIIRGVRIQTSVTSGITGGPLLYAYSLAFGQTDVSMATSESSTTKAPRRIPLGYETLAVNAALGTIGGGVTMTFSSPIFVHPGEYVAICAKNLGTVATVGIVTFEVVFDSYFE